MVFTVCLEKLKNLDKKIWLLIGAVAIILIISVITIATCSTTFETFPPEISAVGDWIVWPSNYDNGWSQPFLQIRISENSITLVNSEEFEDEETPSISFPYTQTKDEHYTYLDILSFDYEMVFVLVDESTLFICEKTSYGNYPSVTPNGVKFDSEAEMIAHRCKYNDDISWDTIDDFYGYEASEFKKIINDSKGNYDSRLPDNLDKKMLEDGLGADWETITEYCTMIYYESCSLLYLFEPMTAGNAVLIYVAPNGSLILPVHRLALKYLNSDSYDSSDMITDHNFVITYGGDW